MISLKRFAGIAGSTYLICHITYNQFHYEQQQKTLREAEAEVLRSYGRADYQAVLRYDADGGATFNQLRI